MNNYLGPAYIPVQLYLRRSVHLSERYFAAGKRAHIISRVN
jgi:hypothetical protein